MSEQVQRLYDIFNELASHGGKKDKELILEKHKGDEDFRYALHFLYNPFVLTRISAKKIKKEIESFRPFDVSLGSHDFEDITQLMAYLKIISRGRDYDIYVAQTFINNQPTDELKKFVTQIVTKDLKVGITEKTINKVYGKGTIPSYGVMLAEPYEKKEAKVKGQFYVTLKIDGNRCTAFVKDGEVKFFTRKGQPIFGLVELEEQFKLLPDAVYDGELLLINKDNLNSADLFRATQKVVRKDGDKVGLDFHVFDSVTHADFENGKSVRVYAQRRNLLENLFSRESIAELQNVKLLPVLYVGEDKQMIARLVAWAEEQGFEGVMVNTADGHYVTKRTADLLKVKTMHSADLLVMSAEKAIDGQFEGLLSRVNVEYKGNLVGVGSGFTLEDRRNFIDDPDLIVGKIIEVQFFEESKDEKTGQPSLRFPVYKGIRHDKGVEDIRYE